MTTTADKLRLKVANKEREMQVKQMEIKSFTDRGVSLCFAAIVTKTHPFEAERAVKQMIAECEGYLKKMEEYETLMAEYKNLLLSA